MVIIIDRINRQTLTIAYAYPTDGDSATPSSNYRSRTGSVAPGLPRPISLIQDYFPVYTVGLPYTLLSSDKLLVYALLTDPMALWRFFSPCTRLNVR